MSAEAVNLTLGKPELNELVGLAPTARTTLDEFQKRLCAQGIPFRIVGSRILVSRAAAEEWLRGTAVSKPAGGVRLDLVR